MERLNLSLRKFASFSDDVLKSINAVMREEIFIHNAIIAKKGRVSDRCYFIISGVIKIVGEENEKPVIPYILSDNDFVIATDSFALGKPSQYQLIAIGTVKVVSATWDQLLEISKEHPILRTNITIIQANYRIEKEREVNLLNTYSAQEKFDWFQETKPDIIKQRVCDEDIWVYLNMSETTYYKCKNGRHKGKRGNKQ